MAPVQYDLFTYYPKLAPEQLVYFSKEKYSTFVPDDQQLMQENLDLLRLPNMKRMLMPTLLVFTQN